MRQRGAEAEEVAAQYLESRGYRIRARNFHCSWGELDIVAELEGSELLCIVEVRMRSTATWGGPSATVSHAKQRKVVKAALHFLRAARLPRVAVRFDVISVLGTGPSAQVEHIPNAFDAGF